MNRSTILIFSALIFLLTACDTKPPQKTPTPDPGPTPTEAEDPAPDNPAPQPETYVMASIKKTPCYGTCPVFEARFYTDGRVEYVGKMNVEKVGTYQSRVDEATLKAIKDKALEAGFFDFYDKYPTGDVQISDLPTTITHLRIGDMQKTVSNKYQAPEALKAYEKYLLELLDRLEWSAVSDK